MIVGITIRRKGRLGDMVEAIAKPAAEAIDSAFGSSLANCGGCERRKDWLNNAPTKFRALFKR
jgi:hypothetical protein